MRFGKCGGLEDEDVEGGGDDIVFEDFEYLFEEDDDDES